jgi:hypothetical protein
LVDASLADTRARASGAASRASTRPPIVVVGTAGACAWAGAALAEISQAMTANETQRRGTRLSFHRGDPFGGSGEGILGDCVRWGTGEQVNRSIPTQGLSVFLGSGVVAAVMAGPP